MNVVDERPPNNKIDKFIWYESRGRRVHTTPEFDAYVDSLWKDIEQTKANVIAPLGNVALYALTGEWGIEKWRSSILSVRGRKIIPTFHPSYIHRQKYDPHARSNSRERDKPPWEFVAVNDLMRIKEESATPEVEQLHDNFIIGPHFDEAIAYLQECSKHNMIAFDIECSNNEVSCIAFAIGPHDAICIPFTREYFLPDQETDIWRTIASILENNKIVKLGQNLVFDCSFLFRKYGIATYNVHDTMVAAGILYPDFPKGLDFLTSVYTKRLYYKDEGKKWKAGLVHNESFWRYNATDAAVCMEIFPEQIKELHAQGNTETYEYQVKLVEPCTYMSVRGIPVSADELKQKSEESATIIESLTADLQKIVGWPINPNSPKQVMQYFYVEKGMPVYLKRTRSGSQPTTDANALTRMARKGVKEADILLGIRHHTKLRSSYYEMKFDEDMRMRCNFNPIGTKTGRLSSSQNIFGTGGNLQTMPRNAPFRTFMIADAGSIMYEIDLSQADNRTVAYIAPEPIMIKAFESGKDVHRITAAFIFNKSPEDILDEPGSSIYGRNFSERDVGKHADHQLNYNMGYKKFALIYGFQEAEARYIVQSYFRLYPGVKEYQLWIKAKINRDRTLETCFGRKRLFLSYVDDGLLEKAYAHIPQSTTSDIINQWGLRFIWEHPEEFRHLDLLLQVHDSIVFQIPCSIGCNSHLRMLRRIKENLEQPLEWKGRQYVIPAEVKMGGNFGETKKVDVYNESVFEERFNQLQEDTV